MWHTHLIEEGLNHICPFYGFKKDSGYLCNVNILVVIRCVLNFAWITFY